MNSVGRTRENKSSSTAETTKVKNLFSSSSSDEDELDHELASAAARERAKNPHAEQGRARKSRTHLTEARKTGSREKSDLDTNSDDSDEDADKKESERTTHHPHADNLSKTATEVDLGDTNAIRINTEYARNYEQIKRKQELQRLTEKYGDRLASLKGNSKDGQESDPDAESSDDDEDDNGLLLTAENELAFAKTLLAIRKANLKSGASKGKKAPEAGKNNSPGDLKQSEEESDAQREVTKREILKESFFPDPEEQIKRNNEILLAKLEERRKQRKAKFTLADEYRRAIHQTAEDDPKDGDADDNGTGLRKLKPRTAEERAIRDSFLKSVSESTEAFSVNKVAKRNETNGSPHEKDQDELLMQERNNLLAEAFDLVDDQNESTESSEEEIVGEDEQEGGDDDESPKAETMKVSGKGKKSQLRKKIAEEKFLKNFFIKELWRLEKNTGGDDDDDAEEGDGKKGHSAVLAELAQAEEDENFYNEAELWEREYQTEKYRHEEDGVYIETFPRPIGDAAEGLLRKPNTSRKDARQRRKERIEAAKAQRTEELKRLKHLKRLEIDERRALIAAVAGLTSKKHLASQAQDEGDMHTSFAHESDEEEGKTLQKLTSIWTDEALNAPFDPAEFDKKMQQLFSDEYYEEPNMDEEMAYLDAELDNEIPLDLNDDTDAAPQDSETHEGPLKRGTAPKKHPEALQDLFREPDLFNVESLEEAKKIVQKEGDPETSDLGLDEQDPLLRELGATDIERVDKGGEDLLYPSPLSRQQAEGSRQIARKKNGANPKEVKSGNSEDENEALLSRLKEELNQKEEEYNKLHYEAKIAGGEVETRFHYREVPAEDFTLSIEEILCRDDRQLNMLAPMNCYAAYLDKKSNERDRRKIEWRRQKGFREIDPTRSSRHYGDVSRTIVLNPNMSEEEGMKVAEQLRKRLRDDDGELPNDEEPRARGGKKERMPQVGRGNGRGRGAGGPNHFRGGSNYNGGNRNPNSYNRESGGRGRGGFAPRGQSRYRGPPSRGGHK